LLQIAVTRHIDVVDGLHNDGIAWHRGESDTQPVFRPITWSEMHMVSSERQTPQRASGDTATLGRLILLDLSDDRIVSLNSDGSDREVIVTGCRYPDGVVVDVAAGQIYWTNMGVPNVNDGSIERADLDGRNRKTIVAQGGTFTPKQIQLESKSRKLYWCDREGMRVMRADLDGSNVETLVDTSQGDSRPGPDASRWCVGVAVDVDGGKVYWTQKGPDNAGKGRLLRAGIEIPNGQTASNREDIEVLYDGLPEPIDLELDLDNRVIYWTDRGDPPRGNTVNCAPMDSDTLGRPAPQIVLTHLMEGIGIALDIKGDRMFVTDFGGNVLTANLDGTDEKPLLAAQGNLTGIAYFETS
jgi:DNA-binding beta-propeller fold protein YncE